MQSGLTIDPSSGHPTALYLAGLFGFLCLFCCKLLYFDVDTAANARFHALAKPVNGLLWGLLHGVLCGALALIGSGLALVSEHELGGTLSAFASALLSALPLLTRLLRCVC